ncbi:MAG: DegT/DnrJ/EryC1/StrS family aminotransferase [Desulfobacterales bacterium]|nr:DegT/DnrJ/EryC1/StrS family aminotransferase [Desulfobacterales bacterium]MBF0398940.1 DegT/DnrJ/EryC1/StrS family aminotransferase [Desulfobacterales bacterium]
MLPWIPVNEPILKQKELEYVTECISSGWISSAGHFIEDFEREWASYCGMKYGLAMSNGTVALQAAIGCLGLKPGDHVLIPSFTIISCALAVIYNGGIPVLIDCDPDTWCIDVKQLENKIEDIIKDGKLKAIMPVHIYGHPVDMDPILAISKKYGLIVIEDAAEAHGAEYLLGRNTEKPTWRRCGGMAHLSAFSFYANKLITTGEGGMVLTNDPFYAERLLSLRNLCFNKKRRFHHEELGYNFRMTNIQAAIGLAQVERIEEIVAKKRYIGQYYRERLKEIPCIKLPVEREWAKQVYWMYGIVLDENVNMNANEFAEILKKHNIETRPFFLGIHEQPVFHKMGLFTGEHLPVTERIARKGLYLPSGLTLNESQIDYVTEVIKKVLL